VEQLQDQNCDSDIDCLLGRFEQNRPLSAKSIRSLASSDPDRFFEYGLKSFQQQKFSAAMRCMGMTLIQDARLPKRVLDLMGLPWEDVIGLVRKLMQCDPLFDLKLLETLRSPDVKLTIDNTTVVRVIGILDVVSVTMRLIPLVKEMLGDPDPRIQSKAAAFIGKRTPNLDWAARQMLDPNSRVRANVVEILFGQHSAATSQFMWNATGDVNNRVIGNALLGLYRLGDVDVLPHIFQMAERPEPEFRSSAAWVMGATGDSRFAKAIVNLLQDPETLVRTNALTALQCIKTARSTACEKPGLRVSVVGFKQEESHSTLMVVVQDSAGNAVENITPTSWILTDENKIVRKYSVDPCECPQPLRVAFLTADTTGPDGFEFGNAIEGIRRCLPLRRRDDVWSILKLKPTSTKSAAPEFEISRDSVLHLKQAREPLAPAPIDIPICFSGSLPKIQTMLATETAIGRTAAEAIQKASHDVLASHEFAGGRQHLIYLGSAGLEGLLENVASKPAESKVAIHIIALPGTDHLAELKSLAESTGGYFMVAPDPGSIQRYCEVLYTSIRHCYRLSWKGTSSQPTVKLYAEQGHSTSDWLSSVSHVTGAYSGQ